SGSALGRQLGEKSGSIVVLALLGELDGGFELPAGLGRLLRLPPLIEAPATDADDDHQRHRDDDAAVLLPELLEALSADFLVDFLQNVVHNALRAVAAGSPPP